MKQFTKGFLSFCLVICLSTALIFGFSVDNSWANTSPNLSVNTGSLLIAEVPGRAKAIAKDAEGKTQEAMGKVTDNKKDEFQGKAKQAEAQARNTFEDLKEKAEEVVDNITN